MSWRLPRWFDSVDGRHTGHDRSDRQMYVFAVGLSTGGLQTLQGGVQILREVEDGLAGRVTIAPIG